MKVDAHDDAIEQDLRRRESGQDVLAEAEELSLCLGKYVRASWHQIRPEDPFKDNWHIDAMSEALEDVWPKQKTRNLAIWVPPGSMKTITGSICWPTWMWTRMPHWRLLSITYDMEMQIELGMLPSRELLMSDWWQERWGGKAPLMVDLNKRAVYGNQRGGRRYAAAPNAKKVTGRHVHCLLFDDPNDAQSAEGQSDVELDKVINFHDGALQTRFADPESGSKVIIQQRIHEKDLSGHVVDSSWEVLCLPERYNPRHPYAWRGDPRVNSPDIIDPSAEGELLWPSRIGEAANAERRRVLGGHRAAGQLQQEPAAREGEILKRHYWSYYPEEWYYALEEGDTSFLPRFRSIVYSWDTSFKDKTANDPVAGGIWGIRGGDRYLLKTKYERMGLSATKTAMLEFREWGLARWPHAQHKLLIEKKSNGVEIINQFRRLMPGVYPYNPGNDDKTQRAEAAEPDLESGNIFIAGQSDAGRGSRGTDYDPLLTPAWSQEVIEQCVKFPKGTNDDLVDMVTMAVNWVRTNVRAGSRISSPAQVRIPEVAGIPAGTRVTVRG